MKSLHLIAPPLFHGRPEKLIMEELEGRFSKVLGDRLNVVRSFTRELTEVVGVYDPVIMAESFSNAYIEILRQVRDGDSILFVEGWNPLVPAVRHALHLLGRTASLYGILHGAALVPGDMLSNDPFYVDFERNISRCFKGVFTATKYFADKVSNWECSKHVVGLPHPRDCFIGKKEKWVTFNHRWNPDKRPDWFLACLPKIQEAGWSAYFVTPSRLVADEVEESTPGLGVVHAATRSTYLNLLAKSSIVFSSAILETFGYSMLEGHLSGAWTVAPNEACYPELPWIDRLYDVPKSFGLLSAGDVSASWCVANTIRAIEGGAVRASTAGGDDSAGLMLRTILKDW